MIVELDSTITDSVTEYRARQRAVAAQTLHPGSRSFQIHRLKDQFPTPPSGISGVRKTPATRAATAGRIISTLVQKPGAPGPSRSPSTLMRTKPAVSVVITTRLPRAITGSRPARARRSPARSREHLPERHHPGAGSRSSQSQNGSTKGLAAARRPQTPLRLTTFGHVTVALSISPACVQSFDKHP